jgi:hypothetical protein
MISLTAGAFAARRERCCCDHFVARAFRPGNRATFGGLRVSAASA